MLKIQKPEWRYLKEQLHGLAFLSGGGGGNEGICLWLEKFWNESYVLLTGELTKLGINFRSEGFLGLRRYEKNPKPSDKEMYKTSY